MKELSTQKIYELALDYQVQAADLVKEASDFVVDGGKILGARDYEHHRTLFQAREQGVVATRCAEKIRNRQLRDLYDL